MKASRQSPGDGDRGPTSGHHAAAGQSKEPTNPAGGGFRRQFSNWVQDFSIAVGLALVIILFVYQPVRVEGTSMAPLLSDQERIFINKFVYRFEPIERGDVVVFWYPLDHSKSFIKRVIAEPGEMVEIRHGVLFVNGERLSEPYVPDIFFDGSSFGPIQVPANEYFVMGDHRDSSNDSRVFGPVPRDCIYGKAVFAYWPADRFGTLTVLAGGKQ